jgi:hypothetical protein
MPPPGMFHRKSMPHELFILMGPKKSEQRMNATKCKQLLRINMNALLLTMVLVMLQ